MVLNTKVSNHGIPATCGLKSQQFSFKLRLKTPIQVTLVDRRASQKERLIPSKQKPFSTCEPGIELRPVWTNVKRNTEGP